jgi:hypothetical protein
MNFMLMKLLLAIATLLFAFPAFGQNYIGENERHETQCKGAIHGVVLGRDGKPWSGINLVLKPARDYNYVLPRVNCVFRAMVINDSERS